MTAELRYSVVVPAFNAERTLGACLGGLARQTAPREWFEILVVDDGSTDRTRALAAELGARVFSQKNQGAGAARNLGAVNAKGNLVLYIDADCVPDERWIEAMTAPFARADIAGVSGVKKTHQSNLWAQLIQIEFDYRYDRMAKRARTDFIDSATAAYRRGVLLESGGFDSRLMEAEDAELSFRLAERGCNLVLVRDAIVYHHHPESLQGYLQRKYDYARWRAVVYAQHPSKAASDTRTPQSQKLQALLAFALPPALVMGLVHVAFWWIALAIALLFLATTAPFVRRCLKEDPRVACVVPLTHWLAAYASGAGALIGLVRHRTAVGRIENSH